MAQKCWGTQLNAIRTKTLSILFGFFTEQTVSNAEIQNKTSTFVV